jgi:hypothetical protein
VSFCLLYLMRAPPSKEPPSFTSTHDDPHADRISQRSSQRSSAANSLAANSLVAPLMGEEDGLGYATTVEAEEEEDGWSFRNDAQKEDCGAVQSRLDSGMEGQGESSVHAPGHRGGAEHERGAGGPPRGGLPEGASCLAELEDSLDQPDVTTNAALQGSVAELGNGGM